MNQNPLPIVCLALAETLLCSVGCRSAKPTQLSRDTDAILQRVSYDPTGGAAPIKNASQSPQSRSRRPQADSSKKRDRSEEEKESFAEKVVDRMAESLFDAAWSSVFGSSSRDCDRRVRERLREGDENKARLRDDLEFDRWLDERDQWLEED